MGRNTEDKGLLSIEDILYRLDFEESEAIEREISKLLFLCLFENNMSNEQRYKLVNKLCSINRTATLDLHRLFYSIPAVDTRGIFAHLTSTLFVCKRLLRGLIEKEGANSTIQSVNMDITEPQENDTITQDQLRPVIANSDLDKSKFSKLDF